MSSEVKITYHMMPRGIVWICIVLYLAMCAFYKYNLLFFSIANGRPLNSKYHNFTCLFSLLVWPLVNFDDFWDQNNIVYDSRGIRWVCLQNVASLGAFFNVDLFWPLFILTGKLSIQCSYLLSLLRSVQQWWLLNIGNSTSINYNDKNFHVLWLF